MNMMTPLIAVEPLLSRTEVAGLVALAARRVPPIWPLETAIAVNPLAGYEKLPFETAVAQAAAHMHARQSLPLLQWRQLYREGKVAHKALRDAAMQKLGGIYEAMAPIVPHVTQMDLVMARLLHLPLRQDRYGVAEPSPAAALIAKWCAAFFDQGQAASAMPHRALGLYRAVLALLPYDEAYRALTGAQGQQLLLSVPRDPLDAIAEALVALQVPAGQEEETLAALVARLPGWAGHIRWRTEHADPDVAAPAPATMADIVALWLLLERSGACADASAPASPTDASEALAAYFHITPDMWDSRPAAARTRFAAVAHMQEAQLGFIFMTAAEWGYRNTLVPQLQKMATQKTAPRTADAQLIFCIDVRSEPFRRALEAQGAYETLGYAGFFGLPIALHKLDAARRARLLPVLLAPQHDVAEAPAQGREAQAARYRMHEAQIRHSQNLLDSAKSGTATAFATAEATGPLAAVVMAARTLAPRWLRKVRDAYVPQRTEVIAPSLHHDHGQGAKSCFSRAEKLGFALSLFKLTGLSQNLARLVVLVGHGGSAVNNPYAAALDCGACGGHAGGSNARLLAAILNESDVRTALAEKGIKIPDSSYFMAAEHNSTTDDVVIFDQHHVPNSHKADLDALKRSLEKAGAHNRTARAQKLARTAEDLHTGAVHWGEVRPEWGLSGNAAFLVGPRSLSQSLDLEGRVFLHSYDWQNDEDGTALTTILTAPMVVAQWINCQYLFSTIDNDRYGSGDKTTQNIVGGIGVVQGNGGDLRVGLPQQSLFRDDGTAYHVPQRLLTLVYAPFERVRKIVETQDILSRLFGNNWVTLVVIDPHSGKALRWRCDAEMGADATTASALYEMEI